MHDITRASLTFALSALLWSSAGQAQSNSREYDFDIPRLTLVEALGEFSRRTNVQLGYLPQSPEEENTLVGPIAGRFTVEAVLKKILEPIDFSFQWINERTVIVVPPPVVTPPTLPGYGLTDQESGGRAKEDDQGVLVVASRIWAFNSAPVPTLALSGERIKALGVSSVAEALRYLSQQPYLRSEGHRETGEQGVELRGLGFDTTLVLINGRRVQATSTAFDTNIFDLNTIPVTAVERIEVLLDSTPLAAGADAIGGVLNIVLKRDLKEPVVEVHYGSADGGAAERRASVAAGVERDDFRVSTVLDYFSRDVLLGGARERWRDQDYRRFGSIDYRSPDANPGNVTSITLENLPGLPSRFAAVPSHMSGARLSTEDFVATAGQRNLESLFRYRSILPESHRISIVASADWDLSENVLAFAELLYTDRSIVMRRLPATLSGVLVPASNPYNSFGVPVRANFLFTSMPQPQQSTDSEFVRNVLGLQGTVGRWSWELALMRTADAGHVTSEHNLDPGRVVEALAQSDPTRALNVFDDGPGATRELLDALLAPPVTRDYSSESTQATVFAHGRLMSLPAGDLSTVLGAEWRRSAIAVAAPSLDEPRRTLAAALVELRLPLISAEMRVRGVDDLAATVGHRVDRYSDIGTVSNSQVALSWSPRNDLVVRGTYRSAYRAPSLYELHEPSRSLPVGLPDPRRNNEVAMVGIQGGGNKDLKQTTSQSWSTEIAFRPRGTNGLTASVKFWRVKLRDRITPIILPVLLAREELFPERVMRAAPTAADIAAGLPGVLTRLDLKPGNLGTLDASGVDLSLAAEFRTSFGALRPELSATWMDQFSAMDLPPLDAVNRVGVANVLGTIPRWHAVAGITWTRETLSVTTAARFVSSYGDFDVLRNQKNGRELQSQYPVDIQASLRMDPYVETRSPWRGLKITAGVINLFDQEPAFSEVGAIFGYDLTQGDLKGRFAYLRLTKDFQ